MWIDIDKINAGDMIPETLLNRVPFNRSKIFHFLTVIKRTIGRFELRNIVARKLISKPCDRAFLKCTSSKDLILPSS